MNLMLMIVLLLPYSCYCVLLLLCLLNFSFEFISSSRCATSLQFNGGWGAGVLRYWCQALVHHIVNTPRWMAPLFFVFPTSTLGNGGLLSCFLFVAVLQVGLAHPVLYAGRPQDIFYSLCLSQGCFRGPVCTQTNVLLESLLLHTLLKCRRQLPIQPR